MCLQSLQQALQDLTGLDPFEAERAPDMGQWAKQGLHKAAGKAQKALEGGQRAEQGLRKAADKAPKALKGRQRAEQQAVVWYAQHAAARMQGFLSTKVLQKQLQIMCVCFEGLCHEVELIPPQLALLLALW